MPLIQSNGCPIHVQIEGPVEAPVLILSNSLGTTLEMWDGQVEPFTRHFRLVRFDRRGHGRSGQPPGPYAMDMLGRDVLAIMDALDIGKASWCGLSMGGMEGMWLGANASERFERMVLANTSAYFTDKKGWNDRLALVREKGVAAFATANMERWFTKGFRERNPETIKAMATMFAATPLEGYLNCGAAVRDMDHRDLLPRVQVPTLVIIGRHDPATVPEAGEYIRNSIPGAEHVIIDAAHISNIEQPRQFNDAVLEFLTRR
ncbi:MAG: 3-oxoadipate enol-lactonase [Hyphomicrobiales bacterium]|nr:3-oxoadipate enol-lactonase [Hyphomicrobiales bacterium]